MGMFWLAWIIVELIVFVIVAKIIGAILAILLIVLSMVFGFILLKVTGMRAMQGAQEALMRGLPPVALFKSMFYMMGGMLMVVPGFMSSIIGICLLIPKLQGKIFNFIINRGLFASSMMGPGQFGKAQGAAANHDAFNTSENDDIHQNNDQAHRDDNPITIEGEATHIDTDPTQDPKQ